MNGLESKNVIFFYNRYFNCNTINKFIWVKLTFTQILNLYNLLVIDSKLFLFFFLYLLRLSKKGYLSLIYNINISKLHKAQKYFVSLLRKSISESNKIFIISHPSNNINFIAITTSNHHLAFITNIHTKTP